MEMRELLVFAATSTLATRQTFISFPFSVRVAYTALTGITLRVSSVAFSINEYEISKGGEEASCHVPLPLRNPWLLAKHRQHLSKVDVDTIATSQRIRDHLLHAGVYKHQVSQAEVKMNR
jgi:hypothetical protein